MERGGIFSGLALIASQKWCFFLKSPYTSKRYGEKEISLAMLEREGTNFLGFPLLAYKFTKGFESCLSVSLWDTIRGLCLMSVHREGENPSSINGVSDLGDHTL